ncbi:hypothetical protein VTN02DRAFT_4152 [Thermoascus thermophilus]
MEDKLKAIATEEAQHLRELATEAAKSGAYLYPVKRAPRRARLRRPARPERERRRHRRRRPRVAPSRRARG